MTNRTVKPATAMCVVTIDLYDYLLPLNKGLALVDLMQQAKKCEGRYFAHGANRTVWTDPDPVVTELVTVRSDQVKQGPRPEIDPDKF